MVTVRMRLTVKGPRTMRWNEAATTHVPAAMRAAATAPSMTAAATVLRKRGNRTHQNHRDKYCALLHVRLLKPLHTLCHHI